MILLPLTLGLSLILWLLWLFCDPPSLDPVGVSLATGPSVSDCFQIAYYCVRNSRLHPRFINMPPFHATIALGEDLYGRNQLDPLAIGMGEELGFHKLTLTLLKVTPMRPTLGPCPCIDLTLRPVMSCHVASLFDLMTIQ